MNWNLFGIDKYKKHLNTLASLLPEYATEKHQELTRPSVQFQEGDFYSPAVDIVPDNIYLSNKCIEEPIPESPIEVLTSEIKPSVIKFLINISRSSISA
jgi:hypothetical protein